MTKKHFEKLIPEFNFSFTKSSGPGGQHVNTTDTKVVLSWNYEDSTYLSLENKNQINEKLQTYVNKENILSLNSSKTRNRLRNKEDCLKKLKILLEQAFFKPKVRKKTKPTRSSIRKRLDSKKRHSERKKDRKKVDY